ncbi:PQQ-like beta-propeller repeat protein [Halorussus limi]|uniref:PQQ-like beta-propeller repeat protein n=1 Tax=Halorussus limi TaxID=2938695 RepID=A0A8U0HP96_9EURY|nr:PQQ-like beta-propeller repeat protein [Halorussus limi]UPV72865.1 PQQ-like beta-propeller repeat protein [Halorussus limi]
MTRRRTILQYGTGAIASGIAGLTGLNPLLGRSDPSDDRRSPSESPTETPAPTTTTETPEPTPVRWETRTGDLSVGPVGTERGVLVGRYRKLTLLDGETGDAAWSYETDDELRDSLAVADGTVFGTSEAGDAFAVGLDSGDERWETELDVTYPRDVAVRNGSAFVGGYAVYRLAVGDGAVQQHWSLGGDGLSGSMALDSERAYLPRSNAPLTAVSIRTGKTAWQFETSDTYSGPEMTSAATANGRVFAGSRNGTVYALDTATGEKQWEANVGNRATVYGVAGDHLLVESYDMSREESALFSLAPASGARNWRLERDEHVLGAPVVDGDTVFVTDDTGTVYRLAIADATEEQSHRVGSGGVGLALGSDRLYCLDDGVVYALTKSLTPA